MGELDSRVAIVTGSGRGIGEQVARKLSAEGAGVVISDVDGDAAEQVAADLPNEAAVHAADLTETGARGIYFLCSPASDYVHGQAERQRRPLGGMAG
ncbi:MAG: SDR family NAD(P)-dependent oxidoreductase [Dehalococcoidia bacterium]